MVTLDSAGRTMGELRLFSAPADLAELVEHGWIDQRRGPARAPSAHRVVPDGSGHLLVHVGADGEVLGPTVVGARSVAASVDKSARACTVGVRLRTGALGCLPGIDGAELLDRSAPLSAVVGGRARPERLLDEPDPFALHRALLQLVRELAARGPRPDWRVRTSDRLLAAGDGRLRVDALCTRIGVPGRTLRKLLKRQVGLGPKRLARIRRIHGLIRRGIARPADNGADMAADSGFTDQAHMIRECLALLGETPTEFLARGR